MIFVPAVGLTYVSSLRQSVPILYAITVAIWAAVLYSVVLFGWIVWDIHGGDSCAAGLHPVPECLFDPSKFYLMIGVLVVAGIAQAVAGVLLFFITNYIGKLKAMRKTLLKETPTFQYPEDALGKAFKDVFDTQSRYVQSVSENGQIEEDDYPEEA
jgi:hypothetical protein